MINDRITISGPSSEQALVTVVIPCYNQGMYLDEAVASVLNSSLAGVEIVIVNDGSTDPQTVEVLSSCSWPRTRIIHQVNKGLAAARNAGIAAARGRFILPLDSDDMIAPGFLEQAVWLLLNREGTGIVYCYAQLFGNESGVWVTGDFDPRRLVVNNFIPAAAVFPKRAWKEAGGYDESDTLRAGFEDWDFWIRLVGLGYRGRCIHEPLFFYRKHDNSMLSGSRLKSEELTSYILNKNKDIVARLGAGGKRFFSGAGVIRFFLNLYRRIQPAVPVAVHLAVKKAYYLLTRTKLIEPGLDNLKITESSRQLYEIEKTKLRFSAPKPAAVGVKGGAGGRVRVLYILPWLQGGGVESVFLNLIRGLDPVRFEKYIMTTYQSANELKSQFEPYCDGIIHLPGFVDEPEEMTSFCLHFVGARNIDVVHISNAQAGYFLTGAIKKEYPDVMILDTLHMEEPYEPWDYFRFSEYFKDNLNLRVVVSNYLKGAMVRKYSEEESRVRTIYNGIDLTPFQVKKAFASRITTIGFVGRFVEQKQPLETLRVFCELRKRCDSVRMIMYGDGPLKSKAWALARRLGIDGCVSFPGWVKNIPEVLYRDVDILFQPSLREGLPVVGIEAMACGVPVVVSRVPGWNEVVEHGVTGFLHRTSTGFVESLAELVSNATLRASMGLRARKRAEDCFDCSQMVRQYAKLYEGKG